MERKKSGERKSVPARNEPPDGILEFGHDSFYVLSVGIRMQKFKLSLFVEPEQSKLPAQPTTTIKRSK